MNRLLDDTNERYGESGAVSLCLNVAINLLAQALLVVGKENHRQLLELLADQAANRVTAGLVQIEAEEAIRKAKQGF
jgi:ribose 1,5-bisphosphokinase PhnN